MNRWTVFGSCSNDFGDKRSQFFDLNRRCTAALGEMNSSFTSNYILFMDFWIAYISQYLTRRFSLASFLRLWSFHRLTKGIEWEKNKYYEHDEATYKCYTRPSIHINTFRVRVHNIMRNCCMVFMTFVSLSFRLKLVVCAQNVPHVSKHWNVVTRSANFCCFHNTTQLTDIFFPLLNSSFPLHARARCSHSFHSIRVSYHFTKQYFDESNSHKRMQRTQLLVVRFTLNLKKKTKFLVCFIGFVAHDSQCWMFESAEATVIEVLKLLLAYKRRR